MLIINKLIIASNENDEILEAINRLVRNDNGEIDFSIITHIPADILNFEQTYFGRFDNTINEIVKLESKNNQDEINNVLDECSDFMSEDEIKWIKKAVMLKVKYGEYNPEQYYLLNVGVAHNFLFWDQRLPANNKKQFSFYTKDRAPENWVKNLSNIFQNVNFELHNKEQSQKKYNKSYYKNGIRL